MTSSLLLSVHDNDDEAMIIKSSGRRSKRYRLLSLRRRTTLSSSSSSSLLLLIFHVVLLILCCMTSTLIKCDEDTDDEDGNNQVEDENEWKKIVADKFYTNTSYFHDIVPHYYGQLLNQEQIQQLHETHPDLTVIIHLGPMKTRSTYLQSSFTSILGSSKNQYDNYVDVYNALQSYHPEMGPANLVGCFRDPTADDYGFIKCKPEVLKTIHDVAWVRKKNLIISAEFLPGSETNIPALKEYLQPWKRQRVVAYYRRYYDWIISFFDQGNRLMAIPERKPIIDFLQHEMDSEYWYQNRYIVNCVERWGKYFPEIVVFNMHNPLELPNSDIRENFYCLALVNGTDICNKYHRKKWLKTDQQFKDTEWHKNHLVPFIYEELAYHAYHMKLWNERSSHTKDRIVIDDVTLMIQHYQENVLQLTRYDFGIAMVCPGRDIRSYFLQRTLETELMLLPDYFEKQGYDEIKTEFDIYANTKLCHVDPHIVLNQDNSNGTLWKRFFTTILPTM